MNNFTLLRIWGLHMAVNKFLDDFTDYTVEQDYTNFEYIPGKGYAVTMQVHIKETKYLRIDKTAKDHQVAYCGVGDTGGNCAPSNIALDSRKENVLAVLESLAA